MQFIPLKGNTYTYSYVIPKKKKKTYITFLDVTKAYDKAWLDGIMYVMDKQGVKG
jgi:hypothetical protein